MNIKSKQKSARIELRVTAKEKEKIQSKARKCGLSTTEYVKQRALGYEPKGIPPDALFLCLEKLGELADKASSPELDEEIYAVLKQITAEFLLPGKGCLTRSPQSLLCGEKEHPRNGEVSELITDTEKNCNELAKLLEKIETELKQSEDLQAELCRSYDEIISWADLYDGASIEAKKMIVNSMIKRIDVFRDYKLKIEFNFDIKQFFSGIDKEITFDMTA